jgi:hypothetical protein
MNKRAIVTVGVSESTDRIFTPYLERFRRTFSRYGAADIAIWSKGWPPSSPKHSECHYAFKVHAIREAQRRGYTRILWLDSSCSAFAPLTPMWERLEHDGHVLIPDDNALGKWASDHCLATFGITRDAAMEIKLMCGTCFGLDLTVARSRLFLDRLHGFAVPEHFNGTHVSRLAGLEHPRPGTEGFEMSNDERCWGHRSDEPYMSLLARGLNMKTESCVEFIGGGGLEKADQRACIRSGYDLPRPAEQT